MNDGRAISTMVRIWDRWQRIPNPWRCVLGVVFVVLGLFGLVLPVLQGIVFLAVGLSLLVGDRPWVRSKVDAWLARYAVGPRDSRSGVSRRPRSDWISLSTPKRDPSS